MLTRLGSNRNLSIAIVLIYVCVAYFNLIATGIVFNIQASSSHIGRMVAFSEHRRWIISVFDRRSIMNRLYWHDQQVGYVCFIPFVWEQRGVIAAVADQTAMISHLLPMCWATRGRSWGHVMMWVRFGSQGSITLNWHSRYIGTRYSGTWLYVTESLVSIGSDNGLSPIHLSKPTIVNWTIRNKFQWNFNWNSNFSFKKIWLKILSVKWQPFCPGGDELKCHFLSG